MCAEVLTVRKMEQDVAVRGGPSLSRLINSTMGLKILLCHSSSPKWILPSCRAKVLQCCAVKEEVLLFSTPAA